jgi:hypothetical protein
MLDVGTSYKDGSGNLQTYWDNDTTPLFRIVGNLNGSGGKSSGDPAVLTFQRFPQLDFATFLRI